MQILLKAIDFLKQPDVATLAAFNMGGLMFAGNIFEKIFTPEVALSTPVVIVLALIAVSLLVVTITHGVFHIITPFISYMHPGFSFSSHANMMEKIDSGRSSLRTIGQLIRHYPPMALYIALSTTYALTAIVLVSALGNHPII